MSENALDFNLRVLAKSLLPPQLAKSDQVVAELCITGVPTSFIGRRYSMDQNPTTIEPSEGERVFRFGSTELNHAVGVEFESHAVVMIAGSSHEWTRGFVNSSIAQFRQSIQAVVERFPFYDEDDEFEEWDATSRDLREILGRIDAAAIVPDRYWSTFIDDVQMGDFTTEAVRSYSNDR